MPSQHGDPHPWYTPAINDETQITGPDRAEFRPRGPFFTAVNPSEDTMECNARSEIIQRYEDSRREVDRAAHDQDLPATARRLRGGLRASLDPSTLKDAPVRSAHQPTVFPTRSKYIAGPAPSSNQQELTPDL